MFYIIYQTKNMVNGKIYIGCHKTKHIDDDYMGSGTLLKRSLEKYGLENFKKTILHIYDNEQDMFEKEKELVNQNFVNRKDTYNLKIGGYGGFDHINSDQNESYLKIRSENGRKSSSAGWGKAREKRKDPKFEKFFLKNMIAGKKQSSLEKFGDELEIFRTFKGKSHSEASKRKIGKSNSIKQKGVKNSQYGTCWIYNISLKENKKININSLEGYLKKGWIKGRKMKF